MTGEINTYRIKELASALGELNEQVIYVGGATVGLYINDPAAEDIRPTQDVDICLAIDTLSELEQIREELIRRGFVQTSEDKVICRFRFKNTKVDVMNTKTVGWAPANPWFAAGFEHKLRVELGDTSIFIIPLPYFLATKFAAYKSRGNNDPRTSHDFEDIVFILDNRTDLVAQFLQISHDLKSFLKVEFHAILEEKLKQEAVFGNLPYENRADRYELLMNNLRRIVYEVL